MSENESRPGPASTGGYPPLQPPQHPTYAPYYGYQQQPLPPQQPVNPLYQQQVPAPKPPRGRRVALLVTSTALAAALIGGISGAVIATADAPPSATTTSAVTTNTQAQNTSLTGVAGVASKVLPSVVQINTTTGQQGGEIGSGVILTPDGRILTNAHVVSGALTVTVTLSDGTKYSGSVVGADTKNDLAVIQLKNAKGLTAATLGDSSKVGVGDAVVAIGSPGGLQNTVTSGIVSALNRSLADVGGQQQQQQQFNNTSDTTSNSGNYSGLIQTDASINQGNSGGALVNAAGQVIGINSVIYSPVHGADGSAGSVGIGFAIPINTAKTIVAQIVGG